jgi:hypothetical protein
MEITIEVRADHVHVLARGEFDMDEAINRFPEVLAFCAVNSLTRVLVDYRAVDAAAVNTQRVIYLTSIGERYALYKEGGGAPLSIAFVGPEAMISQDGFGEEAAETLGLRIKATTEMAAAVEWLGIEG